MRQLTNQKLSSVQESAVCTYLDLLEKIGIAARQLILPDAANAILQIHNANSNILTLKVRRQWAQWFLQRHLEYCLKWQKALNINRKLAYDPAVLKD